MLFLTAIIFFNIYIHIHIFLYFYIHTRVYIYMKTLESMYLISLKTCCLWILLLPPVVAE